MSSINVKESKSHHRKIKQKRGKKTYDALMSTGFKLLEKKDLEKISVSELAQESGYSVGAFYARFESKDQFFNALIQEHLRLRTDSLENLYRRVTLENLVEELMHNLAAYYTEHSEFWRTVLLKRIRDPEFWDPFNSHFFDSAQLLMHRISTENGRSIMEQETRNIYFAFQAILGLLSRNLYTGFTPKVIRKEDFVNQLVRAFKLISDYENLIKS
jgi:AcrR family transcriptional regulator